MYSERVILTQLHLKFNMNSTNLSTLLVKLNSVLNVSKLPPALIWTQVNQKSHANILVTWLFSGWMRIMFKISILTTVKNTPSTRRDHLVTNLRWKEWSKTSSRCTLDLHTLVFKVMISTPSGEWTSLWAQLSKLTTRSGSFKTLMSQEQLPCWTLNKRLLNQAPPLSELIS